VSSNPSNEKKKKKEKGKKKPSTMLFYFSDKEYIYDMPAGQMALWTRVVTGADAKQCVGSIRASGR
jgi:hypothetical protein